MARVGFAFWSLYARFARRHNHCPYCGSIFHIRLQRKKLLIEARKCQYCGLIFRWPADSLDKATRFYAGQYRSGMITSLPSVDELSELRANGFGNSCYDKSDYVDLVKKIVPAPARVFDFGASWGYVGYQLQKAGYIVEGFELSQARAEFGRRHLGLSIYSSWEQLHSLPLPRYDVAFTAHTLEHLYDLWGALDKLAEAVVPGGILVIIVPNGGGREARELGVRWGPYIGETHTISFTADWFRQNLPRHGFQTVDLFSPSPGGRDRTCEGWELVCVARYEIYSSFSNQHL